MTTPPTSSSSTPASTQTPAADPFSNLYRMSATAGVGANDYVAVNTPAVITILAGIASALTLLSPFLVLIPLAAIVFGVVALVQISRSNGTQTGNFLAAGGILLALAFSLFVGYREYAQRVALAESTQEIRQLITDFSSATAVGDYDKAYTLFSPTFQSRVAFKDFSGMLKNIEGFPAYGRIKGTEWNEKLEASPAVSSTGTELAVARVKLRFEKSSTPLTTDTSFTRRVEGGGKGPWKFETMSPLFERPRQ